MNNRFLSRATPEEIEALNKLRGNFELWCRKAVKIRTKEDGIRPLILNTAQKKFMEVFQRQWEAEGRVRIIILKARQQGFSTLTSALIYWSLMQSRGKQACVIGRKGDNVKSLFKMYQRIHSDLPDELRPSTRAASQTEYRFDELDSGIQVATAGKDGLGRGDTLTHVHASEMAFWPSVYAEDNIVSLLPTIPKKGSIVIIESTANGMSGPFYELYQDALEGKNDFIPFFSPWYDSDEYAIDDHQPFELTYYEQDMMRDYGLTMPQLAWRREMIANTSGDAFEVEYPSNQYEAFKASGGQVFNTDILQRHRAEADPTIVERNVIDGKIVDEPLGPLKVYRDRRKGEVYTLGVDVAEGIPNKKERDWSVIQVYDGTGYNVATYRAQLDPSKFAEVIDVLGRYYHDGLVAVEKNNHGHSVLMKLNEVTNYPNLYLEVRQGQVLERTTTNLGWHMNNPSKHAAIDKIREGLASGSIKINDRQTLDEMSKYVSIMSAAGNVKMQAQIGSKDDCVTSLAIAIACLNRNYRPYVWDRSVLGKIDW